MRTIQIMPFVKTDNPEEPQVPVARMLKAALGRDENATKGIENLERGMRIIKKLDEFNKSGCLQLEEDEHKTLLEAIERMNWGGLGFFLFPALKAIKDAPMDGEAKPKNKGARNA